MGDYMVRVLQIIEDMGLNSGVSSMLLNYYRYMDHEKVNFDFMTFKPVPENVREFCAANQSRIYEVGALTGKRVIDGSLKRKVEAVLSAHAAEYDIIHGHEPNAAFIYMKLAKKYGIKCRIIHSHNARGADGAVKKLRNFLLNNYGLKFSNVRCACGQKAALYLYHTLDGVKIINNAVDTSRFMFDENVRERMRTELGLQNAFVVGHVGRFAPQKNHEYLLEVFKKVYEKNNSSVLLLIGGGELFDDIKAQAAKMALESCVRFIGITDDTAAYMQAMDVFVLPSRYEGLPVVCVEAQAAGLECVLSSEITREVNLTGRVKFLSIDSKNTGMWADTILRYAGGTEALEPGASAGKFSEYGKESYAKKRKADASLVADAGYEISREGVRLQNYYIRLAKRARRHGDRYGR